MPFYKVDCTTIGGELGLSLNMDTHNLSWYFDAAMPEMARLYSLQCPGIKAVIEVTEIPANNPILQYELQQGTLTRLTCSPDFKNIKKI